jgi:hypothetical protein
MPEFLQDDSGSVRWLCFEIESINWKYSDEIDINQVYSQVWALYNDAAFDYEMTKDEIAENDNLNKYFSITKPEQELIRQYFIPSDEKNGFFFPSTQIREMLMKVNKSSEKIGSEKIGKALISLGFEKISKRNDGNPGYGYYIQATDDFLKEAVKQGTIDEMTDKMKEFITNSLNKNEQGNGKLVEPKIDNQEDLPF